MFRAINADHLPQVDIIVINHNYSAALVQCIESINAQTYPVVEIIIVDKGSTDGSLDIIHAMDGKYSGLKVIRLDNAGEGAARAAGFAAGKGEFTVFMEAGDQLLPSFVETHVWVHLSLRQPVGLSTSDIIQSANARIVVGTSQQFSHFIREASRKEKAALRSLSFFDSRPFPRAAHDAKLGGDVYFIAPSRADWAWSPLSGNCFRRDALALFMDDDALRSLRVDADTFFIAGMSCLTGCVLIDRPLSVYRARGGDEGAGHAQLNQVLHEGKGSSGQFASRVLADYLVAQHERFLRRLPTVAAYLRVLGKVSRHIAMHGKPFFPIQLALNRYKTLAPRIGGPRLLLWALRWSFPVRFH